MWHRGSRWQRSRRDPDWRVVGGGTDVGNSWESCPTRFGLPSAGWCFGDSRRRVGARAAFALPAAFAACRRPGKVVQERTSQESPPLGASTRARSRTGTPVRAQDFESSASAIPPLRPEGCVGALPPSTRFEFSSLPLVPTIVNRGAAILPPRPDRRGFRAGALVCLRGIVPSALNVRGFRPQAVDLLAVTYTWNNRCRRTIPGRRLPRPCRRPHGSPTGRP